MNRSFSSPQFLHSKKTLGIKVSMYALFMKFICVCVLEYKRKESVNWNKAVHGRAGLIAMSYN